MGLVTEILRAALTAGIPVGLASYGLVWWAIRNRHFGAVEKVREMEREAKRLSQERAAEKKRLKKARKAAGKGGSHDPPEAAAAGLNPFHSKWLAFGGGFYGVVGLLTYGVVELREIWDFISGFDGLFAFIAHLGLDTLIGILVGAVKNFVVAIAWPAYWLSYIRTDYIWVWFAMAYGAYWTGAKYALRRAASAVDGA
jgi:hypothetical protein